MIREITGHLSYAIKTYDQCIDHDDDSYNDRTYDHECIIFKSGEVFYKVKDSSKQWDRRKIFDYHL